MASIAKSEVQIELTDPTLPAASALLKSIGEYYDSRYPVERNHYFLGSKLKDAGAVFLGVFDDGNLIGCGAFVDHDGEFAELKSMFVRPEYRGLGLGRRILQELEARAKAAGVSMLRLETGHLQTEAIALYQSAGFTRCHAFGDYVEDPTTILMEKRI